MSEPITKTQRWLDLIAYLVGRRLPVAFDELMERVPGYANDWEDGDETQRASVRRKFERDKDELRRLGVPLETVSYSIAGAAGEDVRGYRLSRRDFYLPYLRIIAEADPASDAGAGELEAGLAEYRERLARLKGTGAGGRTRAPDAVARVELAAEDVQAAMSGLAEVSSLPGFPYAREARSALRKVGLDVPPTVAGTSSVFVPATPEPTGEAVRLLSDALFARKSVSFRYHGIARGETTDREVHPYGLMFQQGRWYLVAFDPMRDAMRVFRVDRMEGCTPNRSRPNSHDYAIPADFRLQDHAGREAWELGDDGEPVRARVRFVFPRSLWAERNGYGEPLEEAEDGSVVRAFDVTQPDPFLRWVLSMAGEASIEAPDELATGLQAMAREVAALHGGSAE